MDESKKYQELLDKRLKKVIREVLKVYNKSIQEISSLAYTRYGNLTGTTFNLDAYPALKRDFEKLSKKMQEEVFAIIKKSVEDAWQLSNDKNDAQTKEILKTKFPGVEKFVDVTTLFSPNAVALKSFITRKDAGMNLSDRVWNSVKTFRHELEAGLTHGINNGQSAASMARDIKKNLKEPEKLFRRVRDENGKLQLSKAAKEYHPGQGVYRSSYKNALRLTGTEVNMSYRNADHERWKVSTMITGIEIKLSNNPNHCEMCAALAGVYPKDFNFTGNHPSCRCFAVPILITDDEFRSQRRFRLGKLDKQPGIKLTTKIPKTALAWYKTNAKRISGWKNLPYIIKYNQKYLGEFG